MNAILKSCLGCKQEFLVMLKELKRNKGKYCSVTCYTKHRKQKINHLCLNCNTTTTNNKFCSRSCSNIFNPRKVSLNHCSICNVSIFKAAKRCRNCYLNRSNVLITKWLSGTTILYKHLPKTIREYLIVGSKYKCSKCEWSQKHPTTGRIPLEINHIDGNRLNNYKNNLEVLCPNCHSLTKNFRSLNKK